MKILIVLLGVLATACCTKLTGKHPDRPGEYIIFSLYKTSPEMFPVLFLLDVFNLSW